MNRLFAKYCNDSIRDNDGGKVWIVHKEDIFYDEGGETLEEVAQGSRGCPILGRVEGQAG